MNLTNKHNLPAPLLRAIRHAVEKYEGPRASEVLTSRVISVTTLINPPRLTMLRAAHADTLDVDASDLLYMVQGIAFHYMVADIGFGEDNFLTEVRSTRNHNGWVISGQYDVMNQDGWVLSDWKWTSIWSLISPKFDWDAQLNLYAWLAEGRGTKIEKVETWAMLRDWSPLKALKDKRLPPIPFAKVERPLWDAKARESYIENRLSVYSNAVSVMNATGNPNAVPVCEPDERWERKGVPVRCKQYCDVAQFCAFGKAVADATGK